MQSSAMLAHKGFDGIIQGATLSDLIQMECLASPHAPCASRERERAAACFHRWTGRARRGGELTGEAALFEMLRWATGSFTMEEGVRPIDETIQRDWHNLLLSRACC